MALIKCSNCGNMVSDLAGRCPKCGAEIAKTTFQPQTQNNYEGQPYYPPPKKSNTLLYVLIGLLAGLLLLGLGYLFYSQYAKNEQAIEEMKQQSEALEKQNQQLKSEVDDAKKQAEEAKQQKVIVNTGAVHAAEHRAVSAGTAGKTPKVVVNGNKVRLRFAPSLSAGYLTWADGTLRSVPKGTKLKYGGWEDGDWYEVIYEGIEFYISKEFSYLEYQ